MIIPMNKGLIVQSHSVKTTLPHYGVNYLREHGITLLDAETLEKRFLGEPHGGAACDGTDLKGIFERTVFPWDMRDSLKAGNILRF
jgi:hypothetical protein